MFKRREKQNLSDAENTFDKVQHSFIIFKITKQNKQENTSYKSKNRRIFS